MTFKEATDRLIGRVTLGEIAEACGVSENTIQRARMEGVQSRPEPSGWREGVAMLARRRGGELYRLADELEKAPGQGG